MSRKRRTVLSLLVSVLTIVGVSATVLFAYAAPAQALVANKSTDAVIFLHGYGGPFGDGSDVRKYFNNPNSVSNPNNATLANTIASYGWNSANFRYVGFYQNDSNLTSGQYGYDWLNRYNQSGHNWETPGWQASEGHGSDTSSCWTHVAAGNLANEDCSINNLAYHLAWFIYWNFSIHGQNVHVIAHSMGGLIIDSALFERPRQSVFPPVLYVGSVITLGTPYNGLSAPASLGVSTYQVRQMEQGSAYLNSVDTGGAAQGTSGTQWVTIGSQKDLTTSPDSATYMGGVGWHGIVYKQQNGNNPPGHTEYFDPQYVQRTSPTRSVCFGDVYRPSNASDFADNIGPQIERGLSGAWQDWPGGTNWTC